MNDYICREADKLIRRFKTRDPFEIAERLGIIVMSKNLGSTMGCYLYYKKNRYILLNQNLPRSLCPIVCGHELGHDRLHPEYARYSFLKDVTMTDMTSKPEYQANLFASMLLLDEDDILQLMSEGYTTSQIARELYTLEELVLLRMSEMNTANYQIRIPYMPRGDFLKSFVPEIE